MDVAIRPKYFQQEITAMQLALEKLWSHQTLPNCRMYTDSQTAIKAIKRPQRQSD
jgi:ribonuclease HI